MLLHVAMLKYSLWPLKEHRNGDHSLQAGSTWEGSRRGEKEVCTETQSHSCLIPLKTIAKRKQERGNRCIRNESGYGYS